jgi:CDP-diacylglycerol--serine O-phosphatidyltransferase
MKKILPSFFTLSGALAGLIAIVTLLRGNESVNLILTSKLILIAVLFDALDGYTARHFRATSKFGIQLDALTDLVSSGIAPALLLYQITRLNLPELGLITALLIPLLAMIRLAKSVAKQRNQGENIYKGLPLPVLGASISLLVLFSDGMPIGSPWLLLSIALMGILMLTDLRYPKVIYKKTIGGPVYVALLGILFSSDIYLQVLSGILLSFGGLYILWGFALSVLHHRQNKKMEFDILPTPVEKPH